MNKGKLQTEIVRTIRYALGKAELAEDAEPFLPDEFIDNWSRDFLGDLWHRLYSHAQDPYVDWIREIVFRLLTSHWMVRGVRYPNLAAAFKRIHGHDWNAMEGFAANTVANAYTHDLQIAGVALFTATTQRPNFVPARVIYRTVSSLLKIKYL